MTSLARRLALSFIWSADRALTPLPDRFPKLLARFRRLLWSWRTRLDAEGDEWVAAILRASARGTLHRWGPELDPQVLIDDWHRVRTL